MIGEPIIVVLGARCSGTLAVAGVLHHLGVFDTTRLTGVAGLRTASLDEVLCLAAA